MRVLNDNKNEKAAPSELNFFSIATYTVLTALGFTTVFFAPLPLIVAHERMDEPWPKVTGLLGALLALTYLEVQVGLVVSLFVFSLFVSDRVKKQTGTLWNLLGQSVIVALIVGVGSLFFLAQQSGVKPVQYWGDSIQAALSGLQSLLQPSAQANFKWAMLKDMLFYQGPFLLVSGAMISIWFSLGMAAHLNWLPADHRFSGEKLRAIRLPRWVAFAFLITLVASFFSFSGWEQVLGGLSRVFGTLLFIQGCALFSAALAQKVVSIRARTFLYSFAIIFGFYAVIGMGMAGPWFLRRKEKE